MKQPRFIIGRWVAALLALLAFSMAIYHVVVDNRTKGEIRVIEGYTPWSEEILESAATLPLQDGGRIKPLSSYAGFTMLQLHGARSMKLEDEKGGEHKLEPTAWLLDVLFRPDLAVDLPTFRVDNADALEAIGVEPRGRRDRYSYREIGAGHRKLIELAVVYDKINSKERDALQNQIVDLARSIQRFDVLLGYFYFARAPIGSDDSEERAGDDVTLISDLMESRGNVWRYMSEVMLPDGSMPPEVDDLWSRIKGYKELAGRSLFMFPPGDDADEEWNSAGDLIWEVMTREHPDPNTAIEDIKHLEALALSPHDQSEFQMRLNELKIHMEKRTAGLESANSIDLEYNYYQADWFLKALAFFLIGTLCALAMWVLAGSNSGKVFYWLAVGLTAAGAVCCIIAITIRCLIMERPPVGNLYDTIIFIGTTIVVISLITEWMTRRRFALGIAPILGAALILLARRYEVGDASDHMDPLVAVLNSNYWLTTHVITITLGYAAGLLCAFLSAVYVLMRGLGLDYGKEGMRRPLTRTVYGMICFTLLLSLVGTVLGGIWANDSWGRFWGWDPKENGALMIVLWTLVILHARLGGYLKEWGLHVASLFTAVVVTFSWWHVNFLGVGLHNYGFTAGKSAIWIFYATIGVMMAFAAVAAIVEKANKPMKGPKKDAFEKNALAPE